MVKQIILYIRMSSFPRSGRQPKHDFDGDGLTETEGDCDDNDKNITQYLWYADSDGDGYGLESLVTTACTRPEGYAEQIGDCNDEVGDIHLGAQEICDEIDNDCDELLDDADSDWLETSGSYFYNDLDLDGYGGPGFAELESVAREGMEDN